RFGGGPSRRGSVWCVEYRTTIGAYRITFDDGSALVIPLVYGRDVRDWFYMDAEKEPSQAKVVWKGDNARAREVRSRIRLYLSTWENPHPDKTVTSIDYASTMDTACAPFCVAMTVEGAVRLTAFPSMPQPGPAAASIGRLFCPSSPKT